jgi:DNA-binding transcriptional ArsR family regulator
VSRVHTSGSGTQYACLTPMYARARRCACASCCAGFGLSVSQSPSTHHFRVLREAGLIQQREQGNRKLNTLRRDEIEQRFPGLLEAVLGE